MIERTPATQTLLRCDVPRCRARHEEFTADGDWARWPEDWRSVCISPDGTSKDDAGWLLLCPKHAHLEDTLQMVSVMLARSSASVPASES
jgi:hypothetical protein